MKKVHRHVGRRKVSKIAAACSGLQAGSPHHKGTVALGQLVLLMALCFGAHVFTIRAEEPKASSSESETIDPDVLRKVRKLIRGTTAEDVAEREKAWNDIRDMGNLITPGLIELCKSKELTLPMMQSILIALGDSKDERAGPALIELLKSSDPMIRKNAARAIGDSGFEGGLSALEALASDAKQDEDVRLFAAVSGTKLGGEKSALALKELLKSTKPEIRSRAVFALGKFGGVKHLAAIAEALKDAELDVREDAVSALRLIKDKAVQAHLIFATKDENFRVRNAAMDALREATQQKFGNDPKEWQEWYAKQKSE